VTRILAIADEVEQALYGEALNRLRPDLIVSAGDLPFDYLENLVTRANVPLVYVPGNHDPDLARIVRSNGTWSVPEDVLPGPQGCDAADGLLLEASGLRIAGLGGSIRYKEGPNQYTQTQMRWRALRLEARARLRLGLRGALDVLVAHAPPLGVGDGEDPAHQGFAALHRLVGQLRPRLLVHGHVHPVHKRALDRTLGATRVVNVIPYKLLEV
jgi:Icc-related predicted phosphoesterase